MPHNFWNWKNKKVNKKTIGIPVTNNEDDKCVAHGFFTTMETCSKIKAAREGEPFRELSLTCLTDFITDTLKTNKPEEIPTLTADFLIEIGVLYHHPDPNKPDRLKARSYTWYESTDEDRDIVKDCIYNNGPIYADFGILDAFYEKSWKRNVYYGHGLDDDDPRVTHHAVTLIGFKSNH